MSKINISLVKPQSDAEVGEIYNFNVIAFADSQDFAWTEENIKNEIKAGWSLYSVLVEKEIICALFLKKDVKTLLTKNTPIKINHQGKGFSHNIKEFYEKYAKDNGLTIVRNYCPEDNFRMISLNEGHDYEKTGSCLKGNANLIEWEKKL